MKTKTTITLTLLMLGMPLLSFAAGGKAPTEQISKATTAQALLEGSYAGFVESDSGDELHLIVKPLAERKGSFMGFAIVLKKAQDRKSFDDSVLLDAATASVFVIDPIDSASYTMTPVGANHSNIGIFDDNPTLSLTVSSDRILVVPANTSNRLGFIQNVTLTHDSSLVLGSPQDGFHVLRTKSKPSKSSDRIIVSAQGSVLDIETDDSSVKLRGRYSSRQSLGGLHVLRGKSVSVYGEEENLKPAALAFFVKSTRDQNSPQSLLVLDPSSNTELLGSDVIKFDLCKKIKEGVCARL